MALTPEIRIPQARTLGTISSIATDLRLSQARTLAVYNFPAEEIDVTQGRILVTGKVTNVIEISQARTLGITRGRVYNPKLRAWPFNLDTHRFYVLRLGEDKTLVYDLQTEQWSHWATGDFQFWRPTIGMNWKTPGSNAFSSGSNVVLGDDTFGLLWMLDPEQGYDESPVDRTIQRRFPRVAEAQMISRARDIIPVFQIYLTADLGAPALTGSEVELLYSDDQGHSYVSAGTIEVEEGNYAQEFAWRSLGIISAPGRLFRIADNGAFARIDGLDILNGSATN